MWTTGFVLALLPLVPCVAALVVRFRHSTGGYAVGVLVLGQTFSPGRDPSSLVVAATTLAVAAMFQPLRRGIQRAVDRRSNRRRYDAARTVEAFRARLRDQIDLDTLTTALLAVVQQTMEPTRASLWLRPAPNPTMQDTGPKRSS